MSCTEQTSNHTEEQNNWLGPKCIKKTFSQKICEILNSKTCALEECWKTITIYFNLMPSNKIRSKFSTTARSPYEQPI